jgi:hypothetical protein
VWQEIPLTPTAGTHKPHSAPPLHRPPPPPRPPTAPPAVEEGVLGVVAVASIALQDVQVLDRVLAHLSPEELGRCCRVSRLWRDRIEQDELWHSLFRSEWQQEVNPSPGTYKRWYGAMRSAALSWTCPILQQDCVKHESLSGRVEVRTMGNQA